MVWGKGEITKPTQICLISLLFKFQDPTALFFRVLHTLILKTNGPSGRNQAAALVHIILHESSWWGKKITWKREKENTPGTAGGPGGRDRMLTVKSRKIDRK